MYTLYALHCRRSIRTIDSAAMSFEFEEPERERKKERKKERILVECDATLGSSSVPLFSRGERVFIRCETIANGIEGKIDKRSILLEIPGTILFFNCGQDAVSEREAGDDTTPVSLVPISWRATTRDRIIANRANHFDRVRSTVLQTNRRCSLSGVTIVLGSVSSLFAVRHRCFATPIPSSRRKLSLASH